ncbi:ATP-binding cassette domain-containing protein [Schaalia hyovaginalis]|uniref:Energy-coupling factor transport system ATP-binding protein n=1 Tax=Schaalia hyovaginalis TaxID=29316 RepID=A0A923E333_9ACTO|nr:ATP-binding cassette domain-containing protein [Schaalia hyovaginalis]MBB6333492.1 energy-coupling factor transport system ATP-binding protein [Schaalia hyovaginalis]MDY2669019.1 ATP-binding cassette domain-containing protein [Schaalia hyovaginalis]
MAEPTAPSLLHGAPPEPRLGPASVSLHSWGWRHGGRKAWALTDVDLEIAPGERVLVLGPSGSGKSTLMAGLAGLLGDEDEGEWAGSLLIDGRAPEEQRGRIGLVMQDPEAQVVLARVGDDIAFGMENLAVPREGIWPRVDSALSRVGLDVALSHSTSRLSGGQKQRLALASVLAMEPGLLLLDEPTANLDPKGVAGVRDAVGRVLEASRATLVVIEHRVDVWADLVDRIVVILDGRVAADGPAADVLATRGDELRERGIWLPGDRVAAEALAGVCASKRESPSGTPRAEPLENVGPEPSPEPILIARDLSIGYGAEHPVRSGIDLDIPRGVSTCILGANGAGKTTLALTLAGLLPALGGTIAASPAAGIPGGSKDPHDWKSAELLGRISMVFQEPEYQFVARSVRAELEIGPRKSGIEGEALDALVDEHLAALGLASLAGANPMTLSGGEKRRLSVATALISAPELLILDEPTFGQDRRTWIELVRLLRSACDRGTTLVSITHDPAFVEAMGDRVIDFDALGESARPPASESSPARPPMPDRSGTAPHSGKGMGAPSAPAFGAACEEAPSRRSILDAVNPVTQVLALILMTTPLLASIDVVSAGTALVLELAFVAASRMNPKTLALRMAPILVAAPLASLSMLLYAKPEDSTILWSFGPAMISERSEMLAAGILLRVLALGMPAILLLSRIDPTDMADGFAQVLRLPARPVLASLAAARMTGLMVADWKALEQARRTRGIDDARRIVSAARGSFALLVFALRRSAKLSLTMEARGFGAPWPRTWARESRLGVADFTMLLASAAVPAIALGIAIWTGHFEGLV